MGWTMFFLFVALKVPLLALCYLVWWAIRQVPEDEEQPGGDGGTKRRPRPPAPRPARRARPALPAARAAGDGTGARAGAIAFGRARAPLRPLRWHHPPAR